MNESALMRERQRPTGGCTVCAEPTRMASKCCVCEDILHALRDLKNTPARERLHQINNYIARGVDD